MKNFAFAAAVLAASAGMAAAQTYTINFNTDAAGNTIAANSVIANQYAAWGATFSANPLSGASGDGTNNWATNTNMQAVSTTGGDVGALGVGAPSGLGNILRSITGWSAENGTPNFRIDFTNGATGSLSMLFLGVAGGYTPTRFRPGFDVYDASNNLLGNVRAGNTSATSAQNLSVTFSGTAAYAIVVPGTFTDWVGVDNITFTNIPTPGSLALLGLAGIAAGRRRR
ncbi:MAG: PEP-CTERM sorting domain-containing protein [Planctomycetota bacterium]|nr:PEP-CTERM sorting domain-containing protein [Planctomycetota bacterium]